MPELQMWLQHKVPGRVATQLLTEPGGVALARCIAEAVHKLHRTGIPPCRRHTMADELRILHERLPIVARMKPQWAKRLERLLEACDQLGTATPAPRPCGIHRDFYPDHVIVDGSRLYLLDFDLYCEGDPGLDIGNFLGHLTEQSVRTLGDAYALADREEAMAERFVALSGEATRPAVQAYTTLTLVRHIYLSTQVPERRQSTEALLELCEQRLGTAERAHSANRDARVPPH
jgi:aminoglycoside phosphotransferase (APT) family kinase protein